MTLVMNLVSTVPQMKFTWGQNRGKLLLLRLNNTHCLSVFPVPLFGHTYHSASSYRDLYEHCFVASNRESCVGEVV